MGAGLGLNAAVGLERLHGSFSTSMITAVHPGENRTIPRRAVDARVGMMIFLGSWGMIFLTLFFSYAVLRAQSSVWPPSEVPPLPGKIVFFAWANTALLLASSFILYRANRALDRGVARSLVPSLGAIILLGAVFLTLQLQTWTELWRPGMRMEDGVYQSFFYALTTFHALHVLAGLMAFVWILPSARALANEGVSAQPLDAGERTRHRVRVQSTGMFWHFVDVAWIATFVVTYLI